MSEFLLELYSEEIPPNLQINARNDLQEKIKSFLIEESLKYGSLNAFSSPTRLTILLKNFSDKIKISSKDVRGPKVGVMEDIINNFLKIGIQAGYPVFGLVHMGLKFRQFYLWCKLDNWDLENNLGFVLSRLVELDECMKFC